MAGGAQLNNRRKVNGKDEVHGVQRLFGVAEVGIKFLGSVHYVHFFAEAFGSPR